MSRARFYDHWATHYADPAAALAAFFVDAVEAAASVGALLDSLPDLDGRRHYLANLQGKRDRKQFYLASIEQDQDGTAWPCITFKSFKGAARYWKPRDLAWREWEADKGRPAADESARQAARDVIAAAQAAAQAKAAEQDRQREAGRAAAAAAAVAAWEAAAPADSHPYLTRKGVPSHGLRVVHQGMRARLWNDEKGEWQDVAAVRAGELLIPAHDEAGRLVSLQRIDAAGIKRFVMGGRAHGCHFRIPGTTGRTVLAEGYATGATWHAATGDAVVLAFNAGALEAVAAYIKPDAIAADNDESGTGEKAARATGLPYYLPPLVGLDWNDYGSAHGLEAIRGAIANSHAEAFTRPFALPAVELKGREQTWWNKLNKAADAAEAAALAWAIGRRLSVRVPVVLPLDELAHQLGQTAPAGTMNPATLAAIRDALGRLVEWRKRRALSGVSMSPEALARHRLEAVDALPALAAADYAGVVLVNSPMGSGKTRTIGRPFADWSKHQDARFVATCHRQSLVAELARVLACDHYQETGAEMAWAVQGLATCLPSLVKKAHGQIVDEAGFVFVDEVAQVLRSIAGNVTVADKKTRADMFRALRELVRRARCVIGADAGMDDRVLSFLESCRPGERFRVIQQPHHAAGLAVSFGYGPDALATAYGEALARLSEGERLWIGCGERSRAIEAARVLGSTGARVLLVHGENQGNQAQAEFLRNPEAESRAYDCVIHTGVISSGLSIEHREDGPHFTHGMLLTSGATITPADALQMLRRVRYLRSWTVAVTPNNVHDIDNADAILAGMEAAAGLEALPARDCTDFDAFVADVEAESARHRADFAAGLWWALEHQGFALERMAIQADEGLAVELKAIRAELRDERRAAILAAPDLTDDEARRLRERPTSTEADALALLRHRIKTDLALDELDADALDVWDEGRGPRRMDRWSAAALGVADTHDHPGADLAMRRFSKARALAYAWLLEGVELGAGLRITSDLAQKLVARVLERRFLLAFLGIVPAKYARHTGDKPFPAPAYPVREVGEILERMGLELKRREGTSTPTCPDAPLEEITACGGKPARNRWHEVTAESWAAVSRWAEQRNRRRLASVVKRREATAAAWRDVRRTLIQRAPGLTRREGELLILDALRHQGRSAHAWITVHWWQTHQAARCTA